MNIKCSQVRKFLCANSSRSVFFCLSTPNLIWDLTQIISHQITIAVTAACKFTIFLNILVIVAVKKIRELQTNPNILIASLAVADLLVGAVSMPQTISVDALIIRWTCIRRHYLYNKSHYWLCTVHC